MRYYALPRVDGGVEILHTNKDPRVVLGKWSSRRRAEITGEITEIQRGDIPTNRANRSAWVLDKGKVKVDEEKVEVEKIEVEK